MIAVSSFRTPQDITYWLPATNNGTGGKTWAAAVKIKARIASSKDTVFTSEGKEITASKAVYSRTVLPEGTYVIEGDSTAEASPVDGAQLVIKERSNSTMTDMSKVWLQ